MPGAVNRNIELIKWIAVILMTADHINKYLYNWTIPGLFELGRLAMPLFALVLGVNLARLDTESLKFDMPVIKRLAVFCAISTPIFIILGGVSKLGLPLNILATLLVGTITFVLMQRRQYAAALAVFLFGGWGVEFWWFGVAVVVAAAWFFVLPNLPRLMLLLIAISSLEIINQNYYALLAVPVFFIAAKIPLSLPRWKWFFYIYYPLHLSVLLCIKLEMKKVGYFFAI